MRARLIRFLFGLHRWMGVVLGLLMLMWCLSGVVMIFAPYPSMQLDDRDYRIEGLAPISIPANAVLPPADVARPEAKLRSARIEMLADKPVLRLAVQGGAVTYDLTTGQKIGPVDEAEAIAIASVYAQRLGIAAKPSVKQSSQMDEFTVAGNFNAGRPYWQVRLNDAAGTMLYVSSKTGEIRQRTTSTLRTAAWLGAIPHWLYFTELRKNGKLWTDVIIWTSLAGCFLTVLGLFVGIRQYRRRHSTGKLASPYRGAKFWHHMFGLVFGVLVLTWTFSGFASMNPWGWLEVAQPAGEAAERLTGEPPSWSDARPALEAQLAALRARGGETQALASTVSESRLRFVATMADRSRVRFGADGQPDPYGEKEQERASVILAGEGRSANVELLDHEDEFYYRNSDPVRFPVVRVTVPALDNARFYLDAVTGDVLNVVDGGARGYRWLHLGLHRLDFFGWLRWQPLRDIMLIALMAGVSGVCALGVWMGARKLLRGGKLDNRPEA